MKKKQVVILSAIALVVVVGIVLAIIFISRGDDKNLVDGSLVEGQPTISIWHQFAPGSEEQLYLEELSEQLQSNYDDYQLDVQYFDSSKMRNQLLAANNNGTLPDVVFVDPASLPELVRLNILTSLDETWEDYAEVSGRLLEGAVEVGRRGEHIYGLPFSLSTQMMVYNPELFTVSSQEIPTTIEALPAAVEGISALDMEVYGFGVLDFNATSVTPFIWSNGGELTNVEQNEATEYLNSSSNVQIVEMFSELYRSGAIYDQEAAGGSLLEQFGTGRVGMAMADASFLAALAAEYPNMSYETMLVPAGAGGQSTILDSTLVAIPDTEDAELAWSFVKTLTEDATQKEFASRGIMPASKVALESPEAAAAPFAPFIPSLVMARALPNATEWQDMDNEFSLAMSQIVGGYKDAQKGMDDLANTWDALLP